MRVRFGLAVLPVTAVVALVGCGGGGGGGDGDGGGRSAEDRPSLEREVAENRLAGCLDEAGVDVDRFRDVGSDELDDVADFFTDFDESIFSDPPEELTESSDASDAFSEARDDVSDDLDEAFSDQEGEIDFVECLGFSEREYSDFLEEEFSDDFSDFSSDFSDDFSSDFSDVSF